MINSDFPQAIIRNTIILLSVWTVNGIIAQSSSTTMVVDSIKSNYLKSNKILIGSDASNAMTMKFVPGTESFPPMLKFSAPGGTGPLGRLNGADGGIAAEDSQPNLTCLNGNNQPIPGFLNSFSQMLSVTYNPINNAVTGGQLLLGHNGNNAFFETQGTGALNNNANHPGDLFINSFCNRNVMFFNHTGMPFGVNQTNIVSIGGSLNVRQKIQINSTGSTFTDPQNKLFVFNGAGSGLDNGIKIKHGNAGGAGLKIATYNNGNALSITNNPTSINGDGGEVFQVNASGKTKITTTNNDAFVVEDATNNNQINFKVKKSGETFARRVKVMITNFPDYVFEPNYKPMSLYEIEKYYKLYKHLPEIPTSKEVESNNLDLGAMNVLLVKKIEEMTLLMVELKREIDSLKKTK